MQLLPPSAQLRWRRAVRAAGFVVLGLVAPLAGAEERVGLAPDQQALARSEALTASARGAHALFYNPAGLARPYWGLGLVDFHQATDDEAIALSRRYGEQSAEERDLTEAYKLLARGKRLSFEMGLSVLTVETPYAGTQGFANARVSMQRLAPGDRGNPYEEEALDLDTVLHAGAIAGVAARWRAVSLGVSRYFVTRSRVRATPPRSEIERIAAGLEDDTLDPDTIDHAAFATAELGHGLGTNVGLLVRPFDGNPTGLGVSVLNAGGTRFKKKAPFANAKLRSYEEELQVFADEHGLAIGVPEPLPQLVNVGVTVGVGGDDQSVFTALASVDWQDVEKRQLASRLAGSGEVGFRLPREIARKAIIPYVHEGTTYHLGFLGLSVYGGVREATSHTYGFQLTLHAGAESISPIEINLRSYSHQTMTGGHRRSGLGADLAVTLIH